MLNVNRLRILREVHVRGSLAATARALGYNPSSVSHQISQLETEVGVTLLEPVGRGIRLTDHALVLVGHAEEILRHLEEAEADLAEATGRISGTVNLAVFQTAGHAVLPLLLQNLRGRYPELRTVVRHIPVEEALPRLIAHEFDIVLQEEYPDRPLPQVAGAAVQPLARDPLHLVTPRSWGEADITALGDAAWIMEPADTQAGQWAMAVCRRAGFEPAVIAETSDVMMHVRLVEQGVGAALIPELALTGVDRQAVHTTPVADDARVISVAVRRGAGAHPAIRAVCREIAELLQGGGHPEELRGN
ncbi:LysR family transcriptional regulator [Corynebacterium halotolerans]